jgi:alpha-tubulin suppressor-like RCC1 family protein
MKKLLLFILIYAFSNVINAQCYTNITFGGSHTIAQKSNGTLWGWGYSAGGALMTMNEAEPNPIQLGMATDWNKVTNGVINTFAIKSNGTLWGCGSNELGSLGINSSTQYLTTFQQITTSSNWVKVAPSNRFTIALKADGTIWAWGQNDMYQLGNSPATAQQLFPIQVGTETDWIDIATGTNRTAFAIKSNGTIWGWGGNPSSIIIAGSSTTSVITPTQVGTSTNWVKMSVGGQHILAQKADGSLWSWGTGPALGVGNSSLVTNIPQQISTDSWKSFCSGSATSFGVKNDGTLWAWGLNTNGQLGDATSTNRDVPTQIGTDTNWNTVQARNYTTTMATKTDGTVWYWGLNYYGEFGNGSSYGTTYYTSPQQTPGICVTTLDNPTFEKEVAFSLYPNPARDVVTINYDLAFSDSVVEVYDIAGRSISKNVLSSSSGEFQLSTTTYATGLYIVVVKQDDVILAQKKLVIE